MAKRLYTFDPRPKPRANRPPTYIMGFSLRGVRGVAGKSGGCHARSAIGGNEPPQERIQVWSPGNPPPQRWLGRRELFWVFKRVGDDIIRARVGSHRGAPGW